MKRSVSCANICAIGSVAEFRGRRYTAILSVQVRASCDRQNQDCCHGSSGRNGVTNWLFEFKVKDVLKGKWDKNQILSVGVELYDGQKGDGIPAYLKKGGRCILFLKERCSKDFSKYYKSVDPWFGIQPGSGTMAERLKAPAGEGSP